MFKGSTPLPFLGVARADAPASRLSYLSAGAAGAAAVLVTSLVPPLAERSTFFLPLLVIVLTCWTSGWRAGTVAAVAGFTLVASLVPPAGGWLANQGGDLLRLATFAAATAAILAFARAHEKTEARLRQSEALSHLIVDNGPVLIAGFDGQGNTVMFNRACEQLTGYSRDEVIGRPFVQTFVPEAWQSRVLARFRDEPMEVLALPHENPWLTKSHSERLIEWRCFRVAQPGGSLVTLGVGQDVTERHEAQMLVQQILARETAAREELVSANGRKERFIALLAHELRTPLNAAMGWFNILRRNNPPSGADRACASVESNLQMMHALIEDVVDFNRAEFGKLTLNRSRVTPEALLSDIISSARGIAESRQIRLRSSIPSNLPAIEADPKRLRQVLLNVLGNALKFTQPGGEVIVAARAEREGLTISVTDNGPGIAPEHLQRIFDPLWQPAGGERSDGLGLGLALVKRLVEAHGGEVRVASDGAARGTQVTLTMPLKGAAQTEIAV